MTTQNRWFTTIILVSAWGALAASRWSCAQQTRFEMGMRLRFVERALEENRSDAFRRAALPHLERAVQSFFQMSMSEAARALDDARAEGLPEEHRHLFERTRNISCVLPRRAVSLGTESISIDIKPFYGSPTWDGVTLTTVGHPYDDESGEEPRNPTSFSTKLSNERRQSFQLKVADWPPGDYRLQFIAQSNGASVQIGEQMLSLIADLDARLESLAAARDAGFPHARQTEANSLAWNIRLLQQLASGNGMETDFPACRLLETCERGLKRLGAGGAYVASGDATEYWLVLSGDEWKVPARIKLPPTGTAPHPVPLVIALHGAGGSENMFFDGYGDGKLVRLASERGWAVVALRVGLGGSAPLEALVNDLGHDIPIDHTRVFIVGHSMGVGAALRFATNSPLRPCALALLGGGGGIGRNVDLNAVRFFVAAGSHDFGRAGARRLANSLQSAGCQVEYREYQDIEHLAIVQVALDDVFAFFDRLAGETEKTQ